MLELIILLLLLLLLLQNRRLGRRRESNYFFIDCLVKHCDNFYVRDFASDTEIFKLELNEQQYHSLAEFLQDFSDGGTLQRALENRFEYGRFSLEDKNKEIRIIASLYKVGLNQIAILFFDFSKSAKAIGVLEKESKSLQKKLEFFQSVFDSSPFLLYGKSSGHEVCNNEYLYWKDLITLPNKSCTFDVDIDGKSLLVDARVSNNMLTLFGHDNANFTENSALLNLYEKRLEIFLKNTSEKIAIFDHNMSMIAASRAFLKRKELGKAINDQKSELKTIITSKTIKLDLGECSVNVEVIPYMKETILIFR